MNLDCNTVNDESRRAAAQGAPPHSNCAAPARRGIDDLRSHLLCPAAHWQAIAASTSIHAGDLP